MARFLFHEEDHKFFIQSRNDEELVQLIDSCNEPCLVRACEKAGVELHAIVGDQYCTLSELQAEVMDRQQRRAFKKGVTKV